MLLLRAKERVTRYNTVPDTIKLQNDNMTKLLAAIYDFDKISRT